jgi:hypothetical protein
MTKASFDMDQTFIEPGDNAFIKGGNIGRSAAGYAIESQSHAVGFAFGCALLGVVDLGHRFHDDAVFSLGFET